MLNIRERSWLVVDVGSRWIKCVRYVIKGGSIEVAESEIIDIHEEGLLSIEEIGAAIGRLVKSAGDYPLAMVLPQTSAISQVVDLPGLSTKRGVSSDLDDEIRELTGLSTERCEYDCSPLTPFGGYTAPQWITLAKEKNLRQSISPLLGQSLRVEAVTTTGNALIAAFRYEHPEIRDAYLVDLGATQTTIVELRRGDPVHMVSIAHGGNAWIKALAKQSKEAFEETESRLFEEDVFTNATLGPVLQSVITRWHDSVAAQITEWREDSGLGPPNGNETLPIHLLGGFSRVKGLGTALTNQDGLKFVTTKGTADGKEPIWQPCLGAVTMAIGLSQLKASILPRALDKIRLRRARAARMTIASMYVLLVAVVFLLAGIAKQNSRLNALATANQQAEAILVEIEASEQLLLTIDSLASQIEPIVRRQLDTVEALETFRQVQQVHQDHTFTLIRFVDRLTYSRRMNGGAQYGNATQAKTDKAAEDSQRTHAYVLELMIQGSQAERLQKLSEIVGQLRQQNYFSNVDRWVSDPSLLEMSENTTDDSQTYTLLLTLNDAHTAKLNKRAARRAMMKGDAR